MKTIALSLQRKVFGLFVFSKRFSSPLIK